MELTLFFPKPTVHHIYASGPFTSVLIRTNFVKYVSVIFVLQVEIHRTHLPLKSRNITKTVPKYKRIKTEEKQLGNLWHALRDLRTKSG